MILLLLLVLILTVAVEFFSRIDGILKSFCVFNNLDDITLFLVEERDCNKVTNLEIKVGTVGKVHLTNVFISNREEVFFSKVIVTFVKGLTKTTKLTLHQFLNTNVLSDIQKLHRYITFFLPIFVRGVQCMTNLMSNQQVKHLVGSTFPIRKSQHTLLYVKLSSLNVTVLNDQVLCREQFGELTLDF